MFRQHQQEFLQTCRLIKSSKTLRKVIILCVPGGGKSALPVIAVHELIPSVCDNLSWITPRTNLRDQAEDAFTDMWTRNLIGHQNEIRSATNEADLLRDKIGYATTYQSLIAAQTYRTNPHLELFKNKRMCLILDEPNHVSLESEYDAAVKPLVELAEVLVIMGGVLTRHDNARVANLDYLPRDRSGKHYIDLNPSPTQHFIKYTLADATREKAIIDIHFELRDCSAGWDLRDEKTGALLTKGNIDSFEGASDKETRQGLFTALKTDFADNMLREGAEFWRWRKKANKRSQFIVVAPFISAAQAALDTLRKLGLASNVAIATSDDSKEALANIQLFRERKLDGIVTVGMAYEGMNAPPADILICLTHIRSKEWIEQMLHRVTRWDIKNPLPWAQQFATIFAPKDRFFLDIMDEIRAKQAPYVQEKGKPGPQPPPPNGAKLHARESEMTTASAATFNEAPVDAPLHTRITDALKEADIYGAIPTTAAKLFYEAMATPPSAPPQGPPQNAQPEDDIKPPRIREKKLRDSIVALQRDGYRPGDPSATEKIARRGRAIWQIFHKKLEELTEDQLEAVLKMAPRWMVP